LVPNRDDLGRAHRKKATRKRLTVHYPTYVFKPEDLLDFIELPAFTKRWEQLGLDEDEDLSALQLCIMADPKSPRPLAKTDGMRKLRFAPKRWETGKSGAARVLYVYFERFGIVLLCLVYGKNEIDNISDAVKQYLNKLIAEVERELQRRYFNK
jgi:hypothetical protein